MEKWLRLFSILLIFITIDVNGENSNSTVSGECTGQCQSMLKSLLEQFDSAMLIEKQFSEMQAKLHEQELIIKSIDTLKETIKSKDIELAARHSLIDAYQSQMYMKNEDNIEKDAKLVSLMSLIKEKDIEISDLKDQPNAEIEELKAKISDVRKTSTCSNCLGKSSDIYTIEVAGGEPFSAPCDSDLAGCGWTVIQRREDGSENFDRTWDEYKEGFGYLRGEFFLGLEKIHLLTESQPHELYVYLEDFQNEIRYAKYSNFVIGNEDESYELKTIGNYSGDAGDAMKFHLNMKFSTKDRDNDESNKQCAQIYESGWWFKQCSRCNLNGKYTKNSKSGEKRISWNEWHFAPHKYTQMMIRPSSA